jgi:hypothetical protein
MQQNRIFFPGNPWPEGHPVKVFVWSARVVAGTLRFDFHLESADYYAEREIDDQDNDDPSSWKSAGVWGNYHSCTLSSTEWHEGGFPVAEASGYTLERLDGLEVRVDDPPPDDFDAHAFRVYLLGHDAVGHHRIRFTRIPGTRRFDIVWTGRAALVYEGDEAYRYEFRAELHGIEAPAGIASE